MHGEPSWQHVAWHISTLGASRSNLVSQLLDRAGFANDRHRKRVPRGLVDLRLQIRGQLEQVGTFAGNLLLLRLVGGVRGGRLFLLASSGRWCTGNFFGSRIGWGRRRLCVTAQHTDDRRNGKSGATCQRAELLAAIANPALGRSSTSATSALDRPHHGVKMRRRDQATFRTFLRSV